MVNLYYSGDLFLPQKFKNLLETHIYGSYKDSIYITYWSLLHILNGILSGSLYLKLNLPIKYYFFNMFIIHTLWEIWQVFIGMSKPFLTSGKNNIFDIILDTLFFLFGAYIVYII